MSTTETLVAQRAASEVAELEGRRKIEKLEYEADMSRVDLATFGQVLRDAVSAEGVPVALLIVFLETFDLYDDAGQVREHMGKAA